MPPTLQIAGIFSCSAIADGSPTPDDEYVVLVNVGDASADLARWSLTLRRLAGSQQFRYLFPRFLSTGDPWMVEPGGLVFVHTGRGTNGRTMTAGEASQIHLFQHRSAPVWVEPGDLVGLYDQRDRLVASWELHLARN